MKRRSVLSITGALLATVVISGTALAAGVTNGGFETGDFDQDASGYDYQRIVAGTAEATAIDGWTVTSGEIDWIGAYWTADEGSKSIDLNGLAPGAISKTFPTTAGDTYVVTFRLAGNPDNANNESGAPAVKALEVVATGNAAKPLTFDASGTSKTAMGWTDAGYSFVANGSSTTITFKSTNVGYAGAAIDNVVVTETVAPGAKCKNNGWRTMVDSANTSFKNQGDCVSYYATGEKNLAN